MAEGISVGKLNPFGSFGINDLAFILLIFFIAVIIVGLIGLAIFLYIQRKKLKYTIPLYKKMGNNTIRVATYKARDFNISMAGDKLWYVPKAKKYIPVGTVQTAPNEYTHFEREDGEWINISMPDIDEKMKQFSVKYVHQDMRAQRISTSDILESRFKDKKSWWERYGHLVTHVIFYMIVMIGLVVIFYQWSDIVTQTSQLIGKIESLQETMKTTGVPKEVGVKPANSFIPIISVLFYRSKKDKKIKNGKYS